MKMFVIGVMTFAVTGLFVPAFGQNALPIGNPPSRSELSLGAGWLCAHYSRVSSDQSFVRQSTGIKVSFSEDEFFPENIYINEKYFGFSKETPFTFTTNALKRTSSEDLWNGEEYLGSNTETNSIIYKKPNLFITHTQSYYSNQQFLACRLQ